VSRPTAPPAPVVGISKLACRPLRFRRPFRLFDSARSAFKSFLKLLSLKPGDEVLLPAYIGWSANEGSGVFDPISQLGLDYRFYRLDDRLRIDLGDLRGRLATGCVRVLVLIHYFGYVDPAYAAAVELARQHGVWVLEDEAHALLTDWVGGGSGRLGDACVFSLHKMLPVSGGGMLSVTAEHESLLTRAEGIANDVSPPWHYDFLEIARRRRRNAAVLAELLEPLGDHLEPLWGLPGPAEVPQTFPVTIRKASRDNLYFALNDAGFGAVSLYHTMIPQIASSEFPAAHRLATTIFNLPVHQDVEPEHLADMVHHLTHLLQSPR
jgi:dTDP-4-amino-4,6-dideoxygalactose transaminase